jgi:hypothetical protein
MTLELFISVLSVVCSAVSVFGVAPHMLTMMRTKSSAAQSSLGWSLAAFNAAAFIFIDGIGYKAYLLAGGNVLSLAGCLMVIAMIFHYRGCENDVDHTDTLADMHTQEFLVLSEAVVREHRRRHERKRHPAPVLLGI